MTAPTSRRAALAKARQSRRPSRLGTPAGTAQEPDYVHPTDAGFPGLLQRVWRQATAAADLPAAVHTLLTLAGHVPAGVQLRALRTTDACALKVLFGLSSKEHLPHTRYPGEPPTFHGELGLTTGGRIVVRIPSRGPLASEHDLVDGVLRVPWPAGALSDFGTEWGNALTRTERAVAECRRWLAAQPRDELLDQLKEAARRTAPFVLYQEDVRYTNFRGRNTITGKTLWPGHPDCALSSLRGMPLDFWSDNAAVLVVCLTLLVRSAGFARIEEANGTQLTVEHVAYLLERTRRQYVEAGGDVPPAEGPGVDAMAELATALGRCRRALAGKVQFYREIHGVLMHKIERVAGPFAPAGRRRERALCAQLREQLPVQGVTLAEIAAGIVAAPNWLALPHNGFATGHEALVYATVCAATSAFDADFAMSRGIRSLPALIRSLRAADWAEIVRWDIAEYFCCVVPASRARRHFGDSVSQVADAAWSMSARMQYNSWHFIAGNLPKTPEVVARDYFVPPVIPDVAYHSDQHHHGHVATKVKYTVRSPQPVTVLGRTFGGFVDLRLLRCDGEPFTEQDVLAAHRGSAFIARATAVAAGLVASGAGIEVTAFDSAWHRSAITGEPGEVGRG